MAPISSASTAWAILLVAGLLEIIWSSSMKASEGFTKHLYTGITLVAAWLSFWLLGQGSVL
jgi:quaternary ammonium compound-resistance protein SugE